MRTLGLLWGVRALGNFCSWARWAQPLSSYRFKRKYKVKLVEKRAFREIQ